MFGLDLCQQGQGFREIRVEREGLADERLGLVPLTPGEAEASQIESRTRIVRPEHGRALDRCIDFFRPAQANAGPAEAVPRRRILGVQADCFCKGIPGIRVPAQVHQSHPEVIPVRGTRGVRGHRFPETPRHFVHVPARQKVHPEVTLRLDPLRSQPHAAVEQFASERYKSPPLMKHYAVYLSLYMTCKANVKEFEALLPRVLSKEGVDLRHFLFAAPLPSR